MTKRDMLNLYNPDTLKNLCHTYGLRPSKQYGQNFLIDETVIQRIIEAANLSSADTVVEVGPGFGVLMLELAKQAGKVVAFEIEKKLGPYWEKIQEIKKTRNQKNNIEIVWGNVLNEFERSFATLRTTGGYKVVANLPYQISSPVIRLFLETQNPPTEMILMVQKEVGERICAKPGEMSLLAVSVQYYANAEILFVVPRTSFWPSPQVDSVVIRIKKAKKQESKKASGEFDEQFFKLVKAGFSQKRKLLKKNLSGLLDKTQKPLLSKIFAELGLGDTARAQELSVEKWVKLTEKLSEMPKK